MNTFWINKDQGETREREKEKWKEREGEKSGEKARERSKREGLVFSSARELPESHDTGWLVQRAINIFHL